MEVLDGRTDGRGFADICDERKRDSGEREGMGGGGLKGGFLFGFT